MPEQPGQPRPRFMRTSDIAAVLGVTTATIRRHASLSRRDPDAPRSLPAPETHPQWAVNRLPMVWDTDTIESWIREVGPTIQPRPAARHARTRGAK